MKKATILLSVIAALLFIGCSNAKQKNNETTAIENPETTPGYIGVYVGTLPCADCEGIKTELSINDDTTYNLKSEYSGKEDGIFEENGTYNLLEGDVIELVTPSTGEKTYYKILDGSLALTADSTGTLNTGELAEFYILKKR